MAAIAIFDFDRTIVKFGTYTPFLIFLAYKRAPWRLFFAPFLPVVMLAYKMGLMRRETLKETMFLLLAGSPDKAATMDVAEDFARRILSRHCFSDAISAIRKHREAGDTLVLATASFGFYVAPFARELGFSHSIATMLREENGRLYPEIIGSNCYGPAKRKLVDQFLDTLGRDGRRVIFYTDDKSDIPMLETSDEGMVVNPGKALVDFALQRDNVTAVRWQ